MVSFRLDVTTAPTGTVYRLYSEIGCIATRTDPDAIVQQLRIALNAPLEYSRGSVISARVLIDRKRAASGERDED